MSLRLPPPPGCPAGPGKDPLRVSLQDRVAVLTTLARKEGGS